LRGGTATRVFPATGYLPHMTAYCCMSAHGSFLYAAGGQAEVDSGGWVVKMGVSGSSFATVWSSDGEVGYGCAAADARVYLSGVTLDAMGNTATRSVYMLANTGGAATQLSDSGSSGVATDQTHVYFTTSDGKLERAPLGGGSPAVLVTGHPFREIV